MGLSITIFCGGRGGHADAAVVATPNGDQGVGAEDREEAQHAMRHHGGRAQACSRISKAGDKDVRRVLYEAANLMLTRFKGWSALKVWGLKIAARRGHKRACVAVARKLAVIMHAIYGSAARCKGIRTERPFRSALIYPASRGSLCSGPSW